MSKSAKRVSVKLLDRIANSALDTSIPSFFVGREIVSTAGKLGAGRRQCFPRWDLSDFSMGQPVGSARWAAHNLDEFLIPAQLQLSSLRLDAKSQK